MQTGKKIRNRGGTHFGYAIVLRFLSTVDGFEDADGGRCHAVQPVPDVVSVGPRPVFEQHLPRLQRTRKVLKVLHKKKNRQQGRLFMQWSCCHLNWKRKNELSLGDRVLKFRGGRGLILGRRLITSGSSQAVKWDSWIVCIVSHAQDCLSLCD